MSKFIRGDQLDKYVEYDKEIIRSDKKKIKKFKDSDESKKQSNKKELK